MRTDPALLERRMRGGPTAETSPVQKTAMWVASLGYAAGHVVPALARRWGWPPAPAAVALAGDALVALSFYGVHRVFRANSFAGATVGRWEGQRIVTSGPYAVVRLLDEERFLLAQFPEYAEYRRAVRWRLVPGVF